MESRVTLSECQLASSATEVYNAMMCMSAYCPAWCPYIKFVSLWWSACCFGINGIRICSDHMLGNNSTVCHGCRCFLVHDRINATAHWGVVPSESYGLCSCHGGWMCFSILISVTNY